MAEYIERENAYKLIKEQKEKETGMYSKGRNTGLNIAKRIIHDKEQCPTADVVKVVRCKNCKYAKSYERYDGQTGYYCQHQNCTFLYGTNWKRLFEPVREANNFCSYGELKELNNNA